MRGVDKRKPHKRQSAAHASSLTCEFPPDLSTLSRSEIIAKYHEIKKKLAMVDKSPQFPNEASRQAMRQVFRAQLEMIGIEQYQNASREGETLGGGFDSSQWVMLALPEYCDRFCRTNRISLLDVGAIAHRFPNELEVPHQESASADSETRAKVSLNVTSIDLNPEDSEAGKAVIKADFFDFAKQKLGEQGELYDVICLSLCVNFEGCAKRRGLMIHLASRLLRSGGLLFLVLPRACVKNSRYLDEERFRNILNMTHMGPISTTYTTKLMKSISERKDTGDQVNRREWALLAKKVALRKGKDRNNFAICLDSDMCQADRFGESEESKQGMGPSEKHEGKVKVKKEKRGKQKKTKNLTTRSSGIRKQELTSNQRKRARRQAMRMQKSANAGNGTGGEKELL